MILVLDVLMALAAYRLWRVIGLDDWPPSRFTRDLIADAAAYHGERRARIRAWVLTEFHEFLTCPWCAGTWSAALVVGILTQFVSVPLPVLQTGAVACMVGLLGRLDG